MGYKVLGDKALIKLLEAESKTASGIVLPDTAKEKPMQGEVIGVGPGRILDNGQRQPLEVKPGDKVVFAKYAGDKLKEGDQEYLLVSERDILAIVE